MNLYLYQRRTAGRGSNSYLSWRSNWPWASASTWMVEEGQSAHSLQEPKLQSPGGAMAGSHDFGMRARHLVSQITRGILHLGQEYKNQSQGIGRCGGTRADAFRQWFSPTRSCSGEGLALLVRRRVLTICFFRNWFLKNAVESK